MYDLIIIGGGPAGSAAAITAARCGAKVLLLERGHFPRHKVCGEFVSAESRVLLSSKPAHRQAILAQASRLDVPAEVIGAVGGRQLVIYTGDEHSTTKTIDVPVSTLFDRWALSLERMLIQE